MTDVPKSVLAGVDEVIDKYLFIGEQSKNFSYKHKAGSNWLNSNPINNFDGLSLVTDIYQCIEDNLSKRPDRKPSVANWNICSDRRLEPISENIKKQKNKSDEVTLERAIAKKWPENWIYQIPVASGVVGSYADRRRAVDLVEETENNHFNFVELKIASDTPLYAAMEILGYGLVYLASRRDKAKNLGYNSESLRLLRADSISLCVLAPESYYQNSNLEWLQVAIDNGLASFAKNDLKMNFRFERFPPEFKWDSTKSHTGLPETLVRRLVCS